MHPDWSTLALQTVNVLVLLWLLKRFLFRPVANIIAARRQEAERILTEAEAARAEAREKAAALDRRARSDADEAEAMRAAAEASAEAQRKRLLAEADEDVARVRTAAARTLRRDRVRLRRELQAEARDLAGTIAARLLARLPGPAATPAILAGLDDLLAALPEDQRRALASGAEPLEVVAAAPMSETDQAACAELLTRRLELAAAPRFRTDPALIAGIELRGDHAALRHSWQAELERVAQELAQELMQDEADDTPLLA